MRYAAVNASGKWIALIGFDYEKAMKGEATKERKFYPNRQARRSGFLECLH